MHDDDSAAKITASKVQEITTKHYWGIHHVW